MRDIIARAYGVDPTLDRFILTGRSDGILSLRFDISATPPEGAPPAQTLLMLRSLLVERFKLQIHTEKTADKPVYALTMAREGRLGPQMKPSSHNCIAFFKSRASDPAVQEPRDSKGGPLCSSIIQFNTPGPGAQTMAYASDLAYLTLRIQAFVDRPIVDATGLTGSFEWRLSWSGRTDIEAPVPSMFVALEEQLGLKVEKRSAPWEVIVIDSVSMPTPN